LGPRKGFLRLGHNRVYKRLITPFNMIAAVLVIPGLFLIGIRFCQGLGGHFGIARRSMGALLNWGLFAGVPSATGFVLGTAVYIFGSKILSGR
jgi:hypothetical protein